MFEGFCRLFIDPEDLSLFFLSLYICTSSGFGLILFSSFMKSGIKTHQVVLVLDRHVFSAFF